MSRSGRPRLGRLVRLDASTLPGPTARRASSASAVCTIARVVDAREHVVEALAHRSLGRGHEAMPSGVMVRRTARRSVSIAVRSSTPRSTSVSMVADTVGRARASRSATSLARSSPRAMSASSRYWGRVRSVQARSSTRASHARVRTSRSTADGGSVTAPGYLTVRAPNSMGALPGGCWPVTRCPTRKRPFTAV